MIIRKRTPEMSGIVLTNFLILVNSISVGQLCGDCTPSCFKLEIKKIKNIIDL